jgi:hypothetical protein
MLDIIILFFLCRGIKKLALEKNLKPRRWITYTIVSWFVFEGIGFNLALYWNGFTNIKTLSEIARITIENPGIVFFSLFCGYGGYLLVKFILEKKSTSIEA